MRPAIVASDLSKKYRLRPTDQAYYSTLRESLASAGRAAVGLATGQGWSRAAAPREFWSLDGLSFDVQPGEVVGVIGHNGAGKSTLLRILSRITEPTRGWAEIRGRVGSLLEVGTGFHEELTGRENLYLNGAILGMRRSDIRRRFDAIVDFAELGAFVDMPVKHYSSGMYMRLAFSVAAHLEPDVLLVDEVLAVGDLAFQRKCLDRMGRIAGEGRTVLFVSHNLAAVKELCQTAIVLQNGRLAHRGSSANGVAAYLKLSEAERETAGCGTRWQRMAVNGQLAHEAVAVPAGQPFSITATLHCDEMFRRGRFGCRLTSATRELLIEQGTDGRDLRLSTIAPGAYDLRLTFPGLWLTPGIYTAWLRFDSEVGSVSRDFDSPPVLINITGSLEGEGRSLLTAPLEWSVAPASERAVPA